MPALRSSFPKPILSGLSLCFMAFGVCQSAPEVPHPVHISLRTDGKPGRGTSDDPFDGSSQEKFDALMRQCGAGTDVVLGPGTFLTNGNDDGHAKDGFFLQPNTRLRGSGKGVTIVKLAALNFAECIHVAICTGAYGPKGAGRLVDFDNVTVEDLTVDCNADGLHLARPNTNVATYGVQLSGNNATVRNVEVIGAYALSGPFESFAIGIFGMTRSIDGATIERCSVRASAGDYVTAIILGGNRGTTASGLVTGNTVTDTEWVAYSGGGTTRSVFSANVADRVGYGFRYDTGEFSQVLFTGNVWNAQKSAVQLSPQIPSSSAGDLSIVGNILRSHDEPVISLTSLNNARVRGVLVMGNVLASGGKNRIACGFEKAAAGLYSDVTVSNNQTTLTFGSGIQPGAESSSEK